MQRLEPHAGIEPAFPAWKAGTLAVVLVRRGDSGWDRTNGLLGFNQALIPTELQSHQSGSRDSNPVHPGPKPGALTLTLHPVAWTAPDSNREHPACKAGALPLGASSPWAAAGKAAAGTSDAHAVQVSSCGHIPPEGWCSAGGGRNRTLSTGFGDRRRNRPLHPYVSGKANRPPGFPCERLPALSCFYPEASQVAPFIPGRLNEHCSYRLS